MHCTPIRLSGVVALSVFVSCAASEKGPPERQDGEARSLDELASESGSGQVRSISGPKTPPIPQRKVCGAE